MKENSMEKCESYYEMTEERLAAVAEAAGVPLEFAREKCIGTDWKTEGTDNDGEHQTWLESSVEQLAEWLASLREDYVDEDALVNTDPFDEDKILDWREQNMPHARRALDKLLALDRALAQNTAEAQRRIAEAQAVIDAEREWIETETRKQENQRRFYELQLRAYGERDALRTGVKTVEFANGSFALRARQPEWIYPVNADPAYNAMLDALKATALAREVVTYEPDKRAIKAKVTVTASGSVYLPGQEEPLPGVRVVEREDKLSYAAREGRKVSGKGLG